MNMNFIEQKRFLIWVIIILLVFNITAVITLLIHFNSDHKQAVKSPEPDFLQKELSLNDEQMKGVGKIRRQFREVSTPHLQKIRETRQELADEMGKAQPDSARIRLLSTDLGNLQGQLTSQIALQYLNIRDLCTPEQALKLNTAYPYLFGLDSAGTPGEGKRYRHRWGARGQ